MSTGIFPEDVAGGLPIRNPDGSPTNNPDIQNAYVPAPGYVSTCDLTALPTDCTARIEPRQINAIVSELLSFAECLDADGPWHCELPNNLCAHFEVWVEAYNAYNDARFVNVTGDTMTGALHLPITAPVAPEEAANKKYVDETIAAAIAADDAAEDARFVNIVGDTMTGSLIMQYPNPSLYLIKSGSGEMSQVQGQMAGFRRWSVHLGSSDPETGANAGSSFVINRFADDGQLIDPIMTIDRASGGTTFRGRVTVEGGSAVAVLNKTINGAGNSAFFVGEFNGLFRWGITMANGDVESGSNSGSNWDLLRYTDAGGVINPPVLHFDRATGMGTVLAPPTAPLGIATKSYVDSVAGGGASDPPFPAGTTMLFVQASAPIGWTKSGSGNHNDRAIRVVNGASGGGVGGVNAFSTVFAQTTTGNHTTTAAESASINVVVSGRTSNYASGGSGNITPYTSEAIYTLTVGQLVSGYTVPYIVNASLSAGFDSASVYWGDNVMNGYTNGSGGGAHNHPVTMNIAYLDVIVCIKN